MKISCSKRKNGGTIPPAGNATRRSSDPPRRNRGVLVTEAGVVRSGESTRDAPRRYRAVLLPGTGGKIDFRPVGDPRSPAPKPGATLALGRRARKDAPEPGDSREVTCIEFSHSPAPGQEGAATREGIMAVAGGRPGLVDEIDVVVEDIAIRLSRELKTALPYEVTVVVPRVDVTKKFQDGKLVEVNVAYTGITVSHSPRFPPRRP